MATIYVDDDYVADGYLQTGITVEWGASNIFVPRSELTLIQSSPVYVYQLDSNVFRIALKDAEDNEAGMPFPPTHRHNTVVVIDGLSYARTIEVLEPYTVEFEDGQYQVNIIGSNNNIHSRRVPNSVSLVPNNSAGLVVVTTAPAPSATDIATAVWNHTQ